MKVRELAVLALACASATPASAERERYRYDPVHTQVLFFADHLGYSKPMGRFTRLAGTLELDQDDWSRSGCDVAIETASLWLGDAGWEKKVLADDFLDAKRHPTITFACTRLEPTAERRAKLHGDLTIRGVTRAVVLELRMNRVGRHSYSLKHVAGFSATGTIRRSDFGIRRLLPAVGDELEVRLEVEAIRE